MRLSSSTAVVFAATITTLTAAIGLLACTKHTSSSDNPDSGDASGDDASDSSTFDTSLGGGGDDATGDEFDEDAGDVATGNCAVPPGTYAVTMTLIADAGTSTANCASSTTTLSFPLPMATVDGGLACNVMADGTLPVCTIAFTCTQGGPGTTLASTGYVQVDEVGATSLLGYESVETTSTAVGMPVLSTCTYNLTYVLQ
jgi:hypothetical protein